MERNSLFSFISKGLKFWEGSSEKGTFGKQCQLSTRDDKNSTSLSI
jgi:hypothetical protein